MIPLDPFMMCAKLKCITSIDLDHITFNIRAHVTTQLLTGKEHVWQQQCAGCA